MSDETARPRRGWNPDDDLQEPLLPEEAPVESEASPRRGALPSEDAADGPAPAEDTAEGALNPFARPGSEEASFPVEPVADPEPMIPAPVFPRSAGEFADSPSPAPRRSALSGTTPVEVGEDGPQTSWASAHRGTLLKWGLVALMGALVVGLIAFFVARGLGSAEPEPSESPSSTPSSSPSVAPEPAEGADLLTAEDLAPIAPASEWSVISTTEGAASHTARALCLSTMQQVHNPTHSFQRTLGTSGADKLAALHRVDVFASSAAAQAVMDVRVQALSNCSEVPARMVRASQIDGLAEDTFQVTLVQEETPAKYHTILLTRDGAAIQLLDVAQDAAAPEPEALAQALVRPQQRIAEVQGSAAPGVPTAVPSLIPAADPAGWLVPIDLPRLNPGVGRWTMGSPQPIDTRGMGCENMELATEAGPTERSRVAYALTQDPKVPERFGIDELLFHFATPEEGAALMNRLAANVISCKERVNTAEVEEVPGVSPLDAEGNKLSGRIFKASQATSDTERVHYQVIVGYSGTTVSYTLITVTPEVQFTPEQLQELATRIVIRASQSPA
ncbi:MAG: hypothetical protein Q4G35_02150 [Propionibacteriaceae bacterium]|nr:hypothetical protein [Propionibacteriaceae bacterium]